MYTQIMNELSHIYVMHNKSIYNIWMSSLTYTSCILMYTQIMNELSHIYVMHTKIIYNIW